MASKQNRAPRSKKEFRGNQHINKKTERKEDKGPSQRRPNMPDPVPGTSSSTPRVPGSAGI